MKIKLLIKTLLLFLYTVQLSAQDPQVEFTESFSVVVKNPLSRARENVMILIPEEKISANVKAFNERAFIVMEGKKEIASQYNSIDKDQAGIVTVLSAMAPSERRTLTVRFNKEGESKRNYLKLTQADLAHKVGGKWENRKYIGGDFKNVDYLRVPPELKDHSYYIRYEGPGWESDKVAYRFYLDQRNAVDAFGKKTAAMVLHKVGLDGYESYHHMQPWGMDVMKVGPSLGLGTIGSLYSDVAVRIEKTDSVTCRIAANGDVYSALLTHYYGWQLADKKHNVKSHISIHSGTRLTHQLMLVTGEPANICTGIVKDKAGQLITHSGDANHWGYMATYGKQSLNSDELGLVIFFNPKSVIRITEDPHSHIVTMKPDQGKIEYYYAAAWSEEPQGIKNEKQFRNYLETVSEELAKPVTVAFTKSKKK